MDAVGRIAVVIATYNGERWMRPCLRSLADAGVGKIVVVDNGSTDKTVAIVREEFAECVMIALERNRGFGGANNIGIQRALDEGARAVLLLNQDTILEEGAILGLVEELRRLPEYGVVGAFQVDYEGAGIDGTFRIYPPKEFWDHLFYDCVEPVYKVEFLPANGLLVRREVFESVGGFDPLFFMYGEDRDWCDRVVDSGWKIGLVPGAVVRHWHGVFHAVRDFRWFYRFEYIQAILRIKRSRRTMPVSFAGLALSYVHKMEIARHVCRVLAFFRCLFRWRRLAASRSGVPFAFEVKSAEAEGSGNGECCGEARVAEARVR